MISAATSAAFAPELELAAACCRWPRSPVADAAVREAAAAASTADFLALLQRHRVGALAHQALRSAGISLGEEADSALAAHARDVVRRNLVFVAACAALHEALITREIPHLFAKGVTLNILAFGSLSLKESADIDLLVDADTYPAACEALWAVGYRCAVPGDRGPAALARWARQAKDTIWRHSRLGVTLELHQRLMLNQRILPGIGARSPSQLVEVAPCTSLPTLAREELFAYLCAHGTFTGWYRLKWAADVAALISREDSRGLQDLHERAVELGAGRGSAVALLVCDKLFGLQLEDAQRERLSADRWVRHLVRLGLNALAAGGAREITDRRFGTAPIHLSNFLIRSGPGYKLREAKQKLVRTWVFASHRRVRGAR